VSPQTIKIKNGGTMNEPGTDNIEAFLAAQERITKFRLEGLFPPEQCSPLVEYGEYREYDAYSAGHA
jgi:hypothetical protein